MPRAGKLGSWEAGKLMNNNDHFGPTLIAPFLPFLSETTNDQRPPPS